MEYQNINKIAVFKFRNIGDVLIMTPALRALRQHFPNAHITAIVNSTTDAMVQGNPYINEVLVYQRKKKGDSLISRLRYEWDFLREIQARNFDMAVDFTSGDRPLWYAWLSGARHRIGLRSHRWKPWHWQGKVLTHGFLPPDGSRHEVEKHLWLLEQAGIAAPKDKSLFLAVAPEAAAWAEQTLQPYTGKKIILVHPVSRWLFKCWENERMAAVIDWLQQKKNCVVVVTSSDQERELERARQIVSLCAHKPLFFEGTIRLEQLAALCKRADCFLGVDTAPMHIAAAVGTPVVALFGPSNAEHWGPWTLKQISIYKLCPCRAEGGQRCDWSKVRECMRSIQVEDVQQALEKWV